MTIIRPVLDMVPLDVWAVIADHLDKASRTSLHLATKALYINLPRVGSLLKSHYRFDGHPTKDDERIAFLFLLDRDLANYRLCSRTMKFSELGEDKPRNQQSSEDQDYLKPIDSYHVHPCGEGIIFLGRTGCIGWSTVQQLMRKISYGWPIENRSFLAGEHFKGGAKYQEPTGWTSLYQSRVAFGRVLYRVKYSKVVGNHFPLHARRPTKLDLEILEGVPSCLCLPKSPNPRGTRDAMYDTVKCAMSHHHSAWSSIFSHLYPRSPALVARCYWCRGTHRCNQCGTEWKVTVRNRQELDSHAYLTVERIIDAGPVDWVLRHDQFSEQSHPVYRREDDWLAIPDREHPCFRTNTQLFKEWGSTFRGRQVRDHAASFLDAIFGAPDSS